MEIEDVTATLDEAAMLLEELVYILENGIASGDFLLGRDSGISDAIERAKEFLSICSTTDNYFARI